MTANLVNVRGTKLLAGDPREQYRQKLARITLDSMVQFVGLLDAEGAVLEINQVALDGGGLRLSDVEGKPFWTTFWWQVSHEINDFLRDAIRRAARGEFVRWDTEIYGRAGGKETIVIDASLMPVTDEQGNVVFITAEGRDITEKKAHEREIARQREELAQLDELKTQFFANVSHEFRTPLTLMLGPLEDAVADRAEPLGPRQHERIAMVQRNGLRLQKLVNALLDFSRAEAGRIRAIYQPTDLASLTQDLASSFRSACEKAGLTLTVAAPPLSQPAFVDHEMWEKIVLNLVSNAFKFTFKGGIKVGVSEEDGHAVLRVSDTGAGIPESELPRIFDRFHRVEGTQGRTYEGTGIGLALVKELIGLHKGEILVESAEGKGTTFTVRVPFGEAHLLEGLLGVSRPRASAATDANAFVSEALRWLPDGIVPEELDAPDEIPRDLAKEPAHILLADDNADMRDYLHRLLATRYKVTVCVDGETALAAARQQRPDLILSDVMMPRLDGFGMLQRLRDDPELAGIPVIFLSARAGDDAKVEGLQRGADDYLVKPFSARELRARVAVNIELSRARTERNQIEAQILEAKVAERTEELLAANERLRNEAIDRGRVEEQLRHVQKMDIMGQLTSGLAHDFNNILSAIIGNLELVDRHLGNASVRKKLQAAARAAERGSKLTEQLLVFARNHPYEPAAINLDAAIESIVEMLRHTLAGSTEVKAAISSGLWLAIADTTQFEVAVLNLALNARDAMKLGGTVLIEARNVKASDKNKLAALAPGDYVAVSVSDTGSGMDEELQARALEPFFTTKEVGKGTGLGLSQVYGFAKQSGGDIRIRSVQGRGTTVEMFLPRAIGAAVAETESADKPLRRTDRPTVLVVDDDDDVRAVMMAYLEELGYPTVEASGGRIAIDILNRKQVVDLLVVDYAMPGLSGIEVAREAHAIDPDLPIIYCKRLRRREFL
ncbi:MAG TPA: ATP-binding protein [Stellaceae bacterium]|jgi:PAS domain S-box-containing protein|nr:ATP-binding protein [Stellaceae bacterium]